jgi:hypothetical protein
MAGSHPSPHSPAEVRNQAWNDEISRRAKELWAQYGKPSGRDEDIWLEAECQLLGTDAYARAVQCGEAAVPPAAADTAVENSASPIKPAPNGTNAAPYELPDESDAPARVSDPDED